MLQSVEEAYNEIYRDRAIKKDKKIIEKLILKKLIEEKNKEIRHPSYLIKSSLHFFVDKVWSGVQGLLARVDYSLPDFYESCKKTLHSRKCKLLNEGCLYLNVFMTVQKLR